MLPFFRRRNAQSHFSPADEERIVAAIREAEARTSGEIRVYIESRCRFVDPVDRAMELFFQLQMDRTQDRNGVLLYLAMKDRQLAVFGDEGIHARVGSSYWNEEVAKMLSAFRGDRKVEGLVTIVRDIGEALVAHFPYQKDDRNELPDNLVFGA
ncbi:MAG: TPM domain-containing protein [Chitinophagia bacterium]|nr:TPM domain-containing protein [Chitinophagia bacterium]